MRATASRVTHATVTIAYCSSLPDLLHFTLPWQGNRVCITSYLNKATSVLSASERKLLVNLGFSRAK